MNVGDRIRVTESVMVYNHPKNRKVAYDLKGLEGEILEIIGRPVTATLPVKVRFEKRYSAHLKDGEFEVI
ncbi:MAG: ferredoxin-thioredoxin reductase variable chain [Limnothrix sp.]